MNALRSAAAGIVTAAAVFLAGASLLAFVAGGYVFGACVYAAGGVGLFAGARRLRPRRRYVFARR